MFRGTTILTMTLLAGFTTGCGTTAIVRSQSPEAQLLLHQQPEGAEETVTPVVGHHDSRLHGELKGVIANHIQSPHTYRGRYNVSGYACGPHCNTGYGAGQNPHRCWGDYDQYPCPHFTAAGPYGPAAAYSPYGFGPGSRAGGRTQHGQGCGPYHYHTFAYKVPKNLVYPQPNQPGGVVTPPYYTVKGPSDFFMK